MPAAPPAPAPAGFLAELDRFARARAEFGFETTLSGLVYVRRLQRWKAAGCRIESIYLRLASPQLALRRIAARVRQGGHNVPRTDVLRRFDRSWENFRRHYLSLADRWEVYDNCCEHRGCWSWDHEALQTIEPTNPNPHARRSRVAPLRPCVPQSRPPARDADLPLEGRQSRGRKTVMGMNLPPSRVKGRRSNPSSTPKSSPVRGGIFVESTR